jgi:glycosyltransferase involved in cell wall biosynthesis
MESKNIELLFFYENNCGGETTATENIIRVFQKNKFYKQTSLATNPLKKTGIFIYISWILCNTIYLVIKIFRIKPKKWIYTVSLAGGVASALLKTIFGYKICFHYHGSKIPPKNAVGLKGYHKITQLFKNYIIHKLYIFFIKKTDLIIVPSDFTKRQFVRDFRFFDKNNLIVVPNGINQNVFRPASSGNKNLIRSYLKIPKHSRVFLYSGRMDKIKNIILLIKVFNLLVNKGVNLVLIIAYPKPVRSYEFEYLNNLRKKITELGLEQKVILLENFTNMFKLYQIADLTVSLSIKENLPMNMLESVASKSLYTAYPAGEIRQILKNIDTRLIINDLKTNSVTDKITFLLNIPITEKSKILNKGYKIIQRYSVDKTATRIAGLLK